MRGLYYICVFLIFVACSNGYNVLVVFPLPGKSHAILGDECVHHILEAGHKVTYITTHPMEPHPNLTVIKVNVPLPVLSDRFDLKKTISGQVNLDNLHEFSSFMSLLQRRILEHELIQTFLKDSKQHFDVAIVEWLYSEFISGIPAVFGCPYIWLSSMEPHFLILSLIDEATNPAYVPVISVNTIPPLSFMERALALKKQLSLYLYREFWIQYVEEREFQRLLGPIIAKRRGVVPSYHEVRYNASMVLGNSHVSVGKAMRLPEAYKAIGGYHVRKTRDPLPQDLQALMDNSTNGVIYFSLGSTLQSKDITEDSKKKLLKVFGDLKQTVLWKFETDLPDRPRNVHIIPWSPQQSVLAHPNCILFITHGGQLSSTEAIHFGVPLIGIPIFADQTINIKILATKGVAKEVKLSNNLAEDLKAAIEEMLSKPSYAKAAEDYSSIYHNRMTPPGTELVHWVRYVVETRGARHLRSVALMVPWYHKCFLDVAGVAAGIILVVFWSIRRVFLIAKTFIGSKNSAKKKQ